VYRIKVADIESLDVSKWNELLRKSEICDAFQTYEWGLVQRNALGFKPYFLTVNDNEDAVGGVMFLKKKAMGLVDSYEIRGGPLYREGNRQIVMRNIVKALNKKKNRTFNLLFVPFPLINNSLEQVFRSEGYLSYPFRTVIIDLGKPLQDIWEALDKRARWGVRKARRVGVDVEEATSWKEWEQFYHLYELHGEAKEYPTEPLEFFQEMFKLQHKKMACLFLAKHEKRTIAGSLFLIYKQNMVFLQNASDSAFLSCNPNNLLQWKSIEWGKENGVTIYDMNGLPLEEVPYLRGVYRYKKRWDGDVKWYYYYLNRRLLYAGMHMVRTSAFAWALFLRARDLKAI